MSWTETTDRIGAYRVVQRLAMSDTAEVLLAKAEGPMGFERTVVLKVLLEHLMSDEGSAAAFAREAAAYARLSDPAIVTLYEFSNHDGRLVMALEHVDGAPLADVLAAVAQHGRTLDDKTSFYIAQRIFAALATAHRAPIIHRDVNPTNVLLSWDGEVKLTDFGFARFMGSTHQSAFGMIKGTFGYMAPEQIEGGAITSRTDIYAAGIVLWELLTHQTAFERGNRSEIEALTMMAEPQLQSLDELRPELPQRLRNAVTRATRPRSEDRDVSASEMVSILRGMVPADIGREKLANWLERLRPELATPADIGDSTVPAHEPTLASPRSPAAPSRPDVTMRPDVPRNVKASSGTAETNFFPQATAMLAEQSPAAIASRAQSPSPPPEETTRVMPQQPAGPQPQWSAPTAPVVPQQASWSPPIITTAPPPSSTGKRTGFIAGLAIGLIVLGIGAGALFVVRRQAEPQVFPRPSTSSSALAASSAPTSSTLATAPPTATSSIPAIASAPPAPPPSVSAPPPPSVAAPPSAPPPTSAAPAASAVAPDMTLLRTEGSNAGRRIFVDGQVVGQTPTSVPVRCGAHDVKLGSSGVVKHMDLPCGGEITVTDR